MHISLRWLIFLVFVTIFVITAPLIVLYTAGYRLNISNRRLQQTGVLAITTFPRGSSILFNGQNLAQKTPYVIQRIMPNMHEVRLQKKGYHEWSQRVRVDEGKTSYITARLFADSQPELLNAPSATLALRSHERAALVTVDESRITFFDNGLNVEVRTDNLDDAQLIGLLPRGTYTLLEEDNDYIVITDEANTGFIVARQGGKVVELPTKITLFDWLVGENLLLWSDGGEVNIYEAETGERTFITREGQTVIDVAWHPTADSFFVVSGDTVSAYDRNVYETREVTPLLNGTAVADIWLDPAGKNLYFTATPLALDASVTPQVYELPLVQ